MPKLSVVVPVLNGFPWVELQVRSLLDQVTSVEYEVVVADNGSSDGSAKYLRELAAVEPRVRFVDVSERRGNAAARNLGAHEARGDLLAFTDQDDICHPDWISHLLAAADVFDAVGGSLTFVDHNAVVTPARSENFSLKLSTYPYDYLPFGICTNLAVRADVFKSLGGFTERFVSACDVDFSWRLQEEGFTLGYSPEAVVFKRRRPEGWSVVRQHCRYAQDDPILFRAHRAHGMRRNWALAVKQWCWLVLMATPALFSQSVSESWTRAAGMRAGRLYASLRERVLFL